MQVRQEVLFSGLLIVVAFLYVGLETAFQTLFSAQLHLLAAALLVGALASLLDTFKSNLLIREGAETTMEYVRETFTPTIEVGVGSMSIMQRMLDGFRMRMTKTLGKTILVLAKAIDLLLKSTAALCGFGMVITSILGLGLNEGFFIGLWIVLSTILLMIALKFSGSIGVFVSLISFAPPVNMHQYTERTKKLLVTVSAASMMVWVLHALELWVLFNAFGTQPSILAVFLITSFLTLLSLAPLTLDGLGLTELFATLVFPTIGVPAAAALLGTVMLETVRATADAAVTAATRKSELARYR
ncbi:MAG: flippase-like domain-containing protein [Candidatus Diapherotrites archaeon]|nr:flippase-like domain-containing protein [Candidatus Diapherotrites archaeon]